MSLDLISRPGVRDYLEAELARRHLLDFCDRMDPAYETARHAQLLIAHLEAVERGDIRRLMVFMPPRHSKTYHVAERFPSWLLGRQPGSQLILACYGAELAERASRIVRNLMRDERWPFPDVAIAEDSAAVNKWATNHGGIVIAAGVGGAMTGFGADLLIIDDPVKGRAEADSETYRATTWDWYTEVARTRMMPRGRIVLCNTRWHEDDLAGRILNSAGASDWTVLSLPAVAEEGDALGRAPGEPLWPEWFDQVSLADLKRDLTDEEGSRAWSALYQQRPTTDEGGLFKRAWFATRYEDEPPDCGLRVLGVDSAFKAGVGNDYSALVTLGATATSYPVLDAVQARWEYPDLKRMIVQKATEQRVHALVIEDTASGQSIIQELARTTRLPVIPIKVTASKEARATAVAPICEAGRVHLPRASVWGGELLDQLAAFPTGAHDDLVDAFVHALGYLSAAVDGPRYYQAHDVRVGGGRTRRDEGLERLRKVGAR